ncbi:MAG: D-alanine--poly(phosphoribitol) ligase subunit DltC [Raoultibacter sp.]
MVDTVQVESALLNLLSDVCEDEVVRTQRDTDLFEAGLLDSMAAIEVLVGIEEEFGVVIAPTAVPREEMNTVNKIIAQVEMRLL